MKKRRSHTCDATKFSYCHDRHQTMFFEPLCRSSPFLFSVVCEVYCLVYHFALPIWMFVPLTDLLCTEACIGF